MAELTPLKLSDMNTATALDANALLYVGDPDAGSDTGYYSKKITASNAGTSLLSTLNFPLLFPNTTAKNAAGAIAEVAGVKLTGTLLAGATSITLSDASITATSLIDVYNDAGIGWESITSATGSVTITFEAQLADMAVEVIVK